MSEAKISYKTREMGAVPPPDFVAPLILYVPDITRLSLPQ